MKDDKLRNQDATLQNKNAADHIKSEHSVSAPQFSPTVQMQPIEEEEELQMKPAPFQMKGPEEEEEELQMKQNPFQMNALEEEEEELQMKKSKDKPAVNSESSTKTALPPSVQMKMEGTLGEDFSNVNIHSNSSKAEGMGAQAYAQGNDVHFAPGKYSPESQSGQELIGHELTHVVQQRQGRVQPTSQLKGNNVNTDKGLEGEADKMGKKAAQNSVNEKSATTSNGVAQRKKKSKF